MSGLDETGTVRLATTEQLRELLRCARALTLHALLPIATASMAACEDTAWDLSRRFHEGLVPMSCLPHPALMVVQPIVTVMRGGLAQFLSTVTWESNMKALRAARLGLGLATRLQQVLEGTSTTAAAGQPWSEAMPAVLSLLQQLHRVAADLSNTATPPSWLKDVSENFERLRTHLVRTGLSWDPDASRLRAVLLPLTDAMTVWGGLSPPHRTIPEFLVEQLILGVARGQVRGKACLTLDVLAGLHASLLMLQQQESQKQDRDQEQEQEEDKDQQQRQHQHEVTGASSDARRGSDPDTNTGDGTRAELMLSTLTMMVSGKTDTACAADDDSFTEVQAHAVKVGAADSGTGKSSEEGILEEHAMAGAYHAFLVFETVQMASDLLRGLTSTGTAREPTMRVEAPASQDPHTVASSISRP
eukprot:NODE_10249_length_1366_cov_3.076675.p1 GENE.NODE_10249_length_1366_cov_3.076675~~NODE_10249_length_1366_cov_3.076675.p1  ORF type:complete len:442 (+),score=72.78 NODE_10249_length_1366_cov_3.076675:76-1326(+)